MKPRFVEDGECRLRRSPEFQARLRELRASIRARYAAELAEAGFFRWFVLEYRMALEFRRERRKIEPSPGALYSSEIGFARLAPEPHGPDLPEYPHPGSGISEFGHAVEPDQHSS